MIPEVSNSPARAEISKDCHMVLRLCKSYQKLILHSTKKPVTTMLTYPWKCTVLHCNHLGNTWKPLVLMTRHFDYCPSASESSAPAVSRCFPGGYNVKLYISRGRLAWWLLTFFAQWNPKNSLPTIQLKSRTSGYNLVRFS